MFRNLPRLAASFLLLLLWAPVGFAQQIISDDFTGTSLDESVWTFVNPLGDGQFSVGGGQLMVSVPGGATHDAWTSGLDVPRVVQYVSDQDFEIEVKFDSSVTQRFQLQGVAVEDESGAFVRADFHYDGTRTRVFTAVVQGGSASVKANVRLKGVVAPMYLRLARAGDVWTHRYSFDGETWQTAATFTHAMTMNAVGVYGGNVGSPAPSHVALVDHFINLASPPDPDPDPEPEYSLSVSVTGEGSVSRSPDEPSYAAGSAVELTALPAAGWSFDGWSGQLSGTANPATITINENTSISANFVVAPVPEYTLTVGTMGQGTVVFDPPGGTYPEGTEVALEAIAADGWTFAGWSGALSGTANPATLVVDASHEVMAMFEALPEPEPEPEYTLSLSVNGEGSVSHSPDQPTYAAGSVVELTALPAAGWSFAGWSGQLSGTANPASVTINENTSISANFVVTPVPEYTLTVGTVGEGTVTLDPPGGTYPEGTEVVLEAIAADGSTFTGWSGALSGTANPAMLVVDAQHEVIATFDAVPEPVVPVILGVTVEAQANRAVVAWSTDVPTSGSVDYGLSDTYGAGTLLSLGWTTSHEVTVADLAPETTYHLRVIAASEAGLESQSGDITFTTSASLSTTGQIVSDDFNGTSLDESVWAFVNPLADGQFSVGGGQLMVSVPGGATHDAWKSGLDTPRVVQYVSDQDFEIEVKFDSSVTQRYQLQGVAVEDEAGAFVRADFYYDGSRTRVFTAVVQGGSASVKGNVRLNGAVAPMYLRLARAGDVWTHRYSFDGETWQTAATFTHAMTMNSVGVYGGNVGSPAPSHVALVDHFINLASPPGPDPEPEPEPEPGYTLSLSVSGEGSVTRSPDQPSYAVGSVVELTALPAAGWNFAGWSGQLSGAANPATITINENTSISANFVVAPVPEYTLTVWTIGQGTVVLDPPGGTYPEGTEVALEAIAADGWTFAGWSGALSGTANPASIIITGSSSVSASFVESTGGGDPFGLSGIQVQSSGPTTATVSWTTNESATSRVDYGIGSVLGANRSSVGLFTQHSVELAWLKCEQAYTLRVSSVSSGGVEASTLVPFTSPTCPNPGLGAAPSIDLWSDADMVVGDRGRAQRWVNILGRVSSAHPLASVSYVLNGGASRALSLGPDLRRLAAKGDFNVEIDYNDLDPGTNIVQIRALDADGRESSRMATITLVASEPPALPFTANWSQGGSVETYAYSVDGLWSVEGDSVAANTLDYDRLLVLGDVAWTDYEATVSVTVNELGPHAYIPQSGAPLVGLILRWPGHTPQGSEQPSQGWYPSGAFAWYRWGQNRFELIGNEGGTVKRYSGLKLDFGVPYTFKVQVVTVDEVSTRYRFKVWRSADAEPASWQMEITDSGGPAAGALALVAHHADAHFGDVEVTFPSSP